MAMDKLTRLKSVLDAYGADPARWPEADRVELAGMLDGQGGLPVEFAAAEQVDRILAAAGTPALPTDALSRLADLARAIPQAAPSDGRPGPVHDFGVGGFVAAAILAASLVLGVYVGTLDTIDPFVTDEEEVSLLEDPFGFESLDGDGGEGSG